MKLVIRTAIFHLLCVLIFALIYFYFYKDFQSAQHFHIDNGENPLKNNNLTDCLLLSTTIQAGVGMSTLYPISFYSKVVLIIHQIIVIFTHLITLYIFTV
jgi:hypothetical protein